MRIVIAIIAVAVAASASAQPAPSPTPGDDVKALNKRGIELLEQKQYDQALAVFKEAYARFRSAKILLNLGTTLKLLERKADAANEYQRYLDAPDSDPSRRAEVRAVLAELDMTVGRIKLDVSPADAEVQIQSTRAMVDYDESHPRAEMQLWRVEPGEVSVRARRDGYQPGASTATVAAGREAPVTLKLEPIPKTKEVIVKTVPTDRVVARPRFGARATFAASVTPKVGGAALVGGTADLIPQLAVDVGVMIGPGAFGSGTYTNPRPTVGAYLGASYAFLTGRLRPLVAVRLPVFFESDPMSSARFSFRAAGGIEYIVMAQLALTAELGVEFPLNQASDVNGAAFVPAIGVTGRI